MRLHHICHGAGFPLVILHGLLGSSDNWQGISRKLGGEFEVCAADLRNHGRSPHDDVFDYDVIANDVLELLAEKRLERSHLMGHSLGGKAAMHLALKHPKKVEKLVVVDMSPRAYEPSHEPIFDAMESLNLMSIRERGKADRAMAPRIQDIAMRQFLLKNLARDEQGAFHWRPNLPVIRRNYGRLLTALDMNEKFEGPALFIKGGKSDYIRGSDRELIQRMFPRSRIEEIPGAGHWIHADAPGKFVELVANFLR